jgi:hypothetical protein
MKQAQFLIPRQSWHMPNHMPKHVICPISGSDKPCDKQLAVLHFWLEPSFFACTTVGTRTVHAFAHARLAGVNREPVPGDCTQLCFKAKLPGSWHRHRRLYHLDFIEEQKKPCSSQSFGCHDELWYQLRNDK